MTERLKGELEAPKDETMTYQDFIASKSIVAPPVGIDRPIKLSPLLKPFQSDIVMWGLKRGRAAFFQGTGTGKTFEQLSWADAVCDETDGRSLILAPLGVAHQTVEEAAKFGIGDIAYAEDMESARTRIVTSNYERLDKFNMDDFSSVVLDESSIIKSHDSKTRVRLLDACADIPYKLACTATPAPNDWVEIGNHAEFLGVMSQKEMLAMFFVHDGSVRAGTGAEWRLKRHAADAFWQWVASWAVMIRSPDDLGYDEPGYVLPPLRKHQITVPVEYKPTNGFLFPMEAKTLSERIGARRESIEPRIAAAMKIIDASPRRPHLIWCGLNDEQDAMEDALGAGFVSIRGSDKPDDKITKMRRWMAGEVPHMITKMSIFGFGMNFQHCDAEIFVGLNDSFEQLFQAIRRCWRFGQTKPVDAYLIASELEGAVVANLDRKEDAFNEMIDAMVGHMRGISERAVRGGRQQQSTYFANQAMELPSWM